MTELKTNFGQGKWIILCWLSFLLTIAACQEQKQSQRSEQLVPSGSSQVQIEHSIGFDVIYYQDWKELLLFRHYNDFVDTVRFALLDGDTPAPNGFEQHQQIQLPVTSLGALSTTHLTMFTLLEALDELKAIETKKYVFSDTIRVRVEDGLITELAPSGKLNLETTIASGIEVLMGVGYPNSQNEDYQTLQRTEIPVILNADWQEKTLLGRAEWIKLLGVLLQKEQLANEVFEQIETSYNETLELVESNSITKPTVITGLAQGDSWYVAGGNSFANHILQTAEVDYPWANTESTGSIRLDFESVYQKGLSSDYWLVPSTAKTLVEIVNADERYQDFMSFKSQQIYNIYGRYIPGGGNDYYESAVMAPHIVLKDIVKIFHQELLPDHQLVYYNQLK